MSSQPMTDGVDVAGLSVARDDSCHVASLRHFSGIAGASADVAGLFGTPLPKPLQVIGGGSAVAPGLLLVWRSPSETLVLCRDAARFAALQTAAADRYDLSLVDQTGGLWVWKVSGARAADLLARLGATSALPPAGETRVSRLAELTVVSWCLQAGEIWLLVDRLYSPHLMAWIRETAADFRSEA
jgi:sarcosine oxidase gamma subunit